MRYVRRQHEATPTFAWPPTREELDLIEVVEANTLCRVHAPCDEPEPAPVVPPDLLKHVTPVRPVPTPLSTFDPLPPTTPPPTSVGPTLPWTVGLAAGWMWLSTRLDGSLLLAVGAVLAISLSAYLSLRTAPVPPGDTEAEALVSARPRPVPHFPAIAFARLEMGWLTPLPTTPAQPPSPAASSRPTRADAIAARDRRPSSPPSPRGRMTPDQLEARAGSEAQAQLRAPRGAEATPHVNRSLPTVMPISSRQPTSASMSPATRAATGAQAVVAPSPALNTRRSPFLSNVIESMPTSTSAFVPTMTPAIDTTGRERVTLPPAPPTSAPPPAAPTAAAAAALAHGREQDRALAALKPTAPASGGAASNAMSKPAVGVAAGAVEARSKSGPGMGSGLASALGAPAAPQQQIYAALHEYERAYERLDAQAVRAVWPSVDTRALERAFHDLKSQTLVFERCDIDVARAQAVAACRGRATYETRAGEQTARSEPREWTFTLQKSDEAWRIVTASAH